MMKFRKLSFSLPYCDLILGCSSCKPLLYLLFQCSLCLVIFEVAEETGYSSVKESCFLFWQYLSPNAFLDFYLIVWQVKCRPKFWPSIFSWFSDFLLIWKIIFIKCCMAAASRWEERQSNMRTGNVNKSYGSSHRLKYVWVELAAKCQ